MSSLDKNRDKLLQRMRSYRSCAVAYSGGVDSAVVTKAAALALGDRAVAITGSSDSLADGELKSARELARLIGIRHQVLETDEFANSNYTRNDSDRCYHCKSELYTKIAARLEQFNVEVVCNGANADDSGDYRPGMVAAAEYKVRSPLAECGLNKNDVRELAAYWELPVWDKPATPCLSSRVAYGEEVTPQRLQMIDRAEQLLRAHNFGNVRVRYHRGDLARLEVPLDELPRFLQGDLRARLTAELKDMGFRFITLDLEGFRTGSLNQLINLL